MIAAPPLSAVRREFSNINDTLSNSNDCNVLISNYTEEVPNTKASTLNMVLDTAQKIQIKK